MDEFNGYQAMAWIAWRKKKAIRAFSSPNAHTLWDEAKRGQFPANLGKPKVEPIKAEMELLRAMDDKRLPFRFRSAG